MARAPKPARLTIDGAWGPKTRAAFDYMVNTSLHTGGTSTTSSDTAMKSLTPSERSALQRYMNVVRTNWGAYYSGGTNGWQTFAKLTVDGLWGSRTSMAMTNYCAYLTGVSGSYWMTQGGGLIQWQTPKVKHLQRWINCAVYREKFILAGTASATYCKVPYLPRNDWSSTP